jgi:hypothetical protein
MLYRILPTHISKFLAARRITAVSGVRRDFIEPQSQLRVLFFLLTGLIGSSIGILSVNVSVFRIGWLLWLVGIFNFLVELFRLATKVRGIARSPHAA